MKSIVTVQYKDRKSDDFKGDEYSYYNEIPLQVGQIVKVPTRFGNTEARVSKINIQPQTIPAMLRKHLKSIGKEHILTDDDGNIQFDGQERLF